MPIKGHILAARPGHGANVEFARKIRALMKRDLAKANVPVYIPDSKPLYDINDIHRLLPHRSPFLLVDKIVEMSEKHIVGIKNVTMSEWYFAGHFPGKPVMPGVLQVEAMAQCGGILALSSVPDPENYLTYFMKIDSVKFKQKVIPGDTLVFSLNLVTPIRRGICHLRGTAYVGNKAVMEAEMMAQMVKVKNIEVKTPEEQFI
jgi:UDP-3-O-[3-hydroxymyristoyl] N-acetylglucosamine deacetylase/3-hydroxyacyl-[acyl-carrier-protein] dehydratase